ncbi:MAG: TraB/GumN family protein [Sarcina sp.]
MGIFKKIGVFAAIVGIMIPLIGCGGTNKNKESFDYTSKTNVTEEATKGYIWEATKNNKSIYLVGTMHPAPVNVNYLNDTLDKIINESDVLGVELDITDKSILNEVNTLLLPAYMSKDASVKKRLSSENFSKLQTILDDFDISYASIKDYSDVGINAVLSQTTFNKIGFTGLTADSFLINKFKELNKEVTSLETPQLQADILAKTQAMSSLDEILPEFDTKAYLDENSKYCNELFDAYTTGNESIPTDVVKKQASELPKDIYDGLHKNRNIGMVEKINSYMKEDKQYVIAVGYMHFFGDDSILKLLENEEYTITNLVK